VCGLKHQKEKRSMDHFAGLDVSVKETSVCIVDDTGKIVREVKVASEPEALLAVLKNPSYVPPSNPPQDFPLDSSRDTGHAAVFQHSPGGTDALFRRPTRDHRIFQLRA
jgi:hypothetical protein